MTLASKPFWAGLGRAAPGVDPSTLEADAKDFVAEVKLRAKRYFDAATQLGLIDAWREADAMYFMRDMTSASASLMGNMLIKLDLGTRKDTRVKIRIPEARSLMRQQLAFLMSEKTSFQCVATMGETRSVMTAQLADTVVNYIYDERIRPEMRTFAEYAIEFGAAATHLRWDATKGDDIVEDVPIEQPTPMQQPDGSVQIVPQTVIAKRPGKSGAPFVDPLTPFDVAYDPRIGLKAGWAIAFERTNLYTLAAQYAQGNPELAKRILDQSTRDEFSEYRLLSQDVDALGANDGDVFAMHFYYADRPELPGGRYALIVGDMAVIDVPKCPLGAGRLPVRVLLTSKMNDCAFSFADGWGLYGAETALNKLRSSELTNFAYFGNQSRAMEDGTRTADLERMSGNDQRHYTYPRGGKPPGAVEVLPMPDTSETLKQELIASLSRVSGFSDVSRGTAGIDKTTSAVHAQVFEAITARNLSLPQGDFVTHEEELANDTLEMTQHYGNTAFIAEIAGKEGAPIARQFAPSDLSSVRRVRAKAVPDSMRGSLARLALLDQTKDIEDPRERAKAVNMVVYGDDEYGKNDQRSQNLISIENEWLTTGEFPVTVCSTENHYNHLVDHQSALDQMRTQPNADPQAIMRFGQHIQEHGQELMNQDPVLAQAMGYPAPPVMPGNASFAFQQSLNAAQMMLGGGPAAPGAAAPGGGNPNADPNAQPPVKQQKPAQQSEAAA